MPRAFQLACLSLCCLAGGLSAAQGALKTNLVASGFSQPLFVGAPTGDSRLFVVQKSGQIRIVSGGSVLPTPFLNVSSLINTDGERGLLGLAFDPNFNSNGRFYVDYIDNTNFNTTVVRYSVSNSNPDIADPTSAQTILTVAQPAGRNNHKGGWIGFRPGEGANLYVATGDGGSGNDPDNNAQNLTSDLGKILRVNVAGAGPGYTVPADNPFVGVAGNDEIWAYGLRNPYRDSFDRATGAFFIADVGQNTREEVDYEAFGTPGGRNYGWRPLEGSGDNPGVADPPPAGAISPIYDYTHASQPAGSASITGGYVYRGADVPGLQGTYFYADYVNSTIYSFNYSGGAVSNLTNRTAELANPAGLDQLVSFGEDGFGNLYIVDLGG